MHVKNSFFIYMCVLRIQLGCISYTPADIPNPFINTDNSTANITIVEKKLPKFLNGEKIKELYLTYNWTEAPNRTGVLLNNSKFIQDDHPKDLNQFENEMAVFSCPLKANYTYNVSWRIIDLVKPQKKIVTKLNNDKSDKYTYVIEKLAVGDDGYYMCIVHDENEIHDARVALLTVKSSVTKRPLTIWMVIISLAISSVIALGCVVSYFKRRGSTQCLVKTIIIEKDSESTDVLKSPTVRIEFNQRNIRGTHGFAENIEYEMPHDLNWEFSREHLKWGEGFLGQGEFGKVLRADAYGILEPETWSTVAVKMLKEHHTDEDMLSLVAEVEIMKMIGHHKNVLSLLKCCTQRGPLLVIMEYASRGNLRDFLRTSNPSSRNSKADFVLNNKTLISFSQQIAEGMEYLASVKCVHRDLAARNVLVCDDYTMKVADFGLARDIQNNEYYRNKSKAKLPVRWMAPEALFQRLYTNKSDVWSFGILLWEIMTLGGVPYPSVPGVERLFQILHQGYRMESPLNCPAELYNLMCACWSEDANDRPNFTTIIQKLGEILEGNDCLEHIPSPSASILSSAERVYTSSEDEDEDDGDISSGAFALNEIKYPLMRDHQSDKSSSSVTHRSSVQMSLALSEGNEYTSS